MSLDISNIGVSIDNFQPSIYREPHNIHRPGYFSYERYNREEEEKKKKKEVAYVMLDDWDGFKIYKLASLIKIMIKNSSSEVCLASFLNKRKPYNENRLSAKGKSACPTPKSIKDFVASRSSDEMVRRYEKFKSKDKNPVLPKRQKALEESNGCVKRSHLLLSE